MKSNFVASLFILILIGLFYFWKTEKTDFYSNDSTLDEENIGASTKHNVPIQNSTKDDEPDDRIPSSTPTHRTSKIPETASSLIRSEEDFLRKFGNSWKFRRKENGKLKYISGGLIKNIGTDQKSISNFAKEIAPLFDLPPEQLEHSPKEINKTKHSQAFWIEQYVGDFAVYQGAISLHLKNDGSVFMIKGDTRPVGEFNHNPRISQAEAQDIIKRIYGDNLIDIIPGQDSNPVVFAKDNQDTELAWTFNTTIRSQKDIRWEILIGAESGKELNKRITEVH